MMSNRFVIVGNSLVRLSVAHVYTRTMFQFFLIAAFISGCDSRNKSAGESPDGYVTPSHYPKMKTVWAEEFNGKEIDTNYWSFQLGNGCPNLCGWGNRELECYNRENTKVVNGCLVIEAKENEADLCPYTSSRITTQGKFNFRYGRVDVRAKLPERHGIWPAVWMLGRNITTVAWSACGEIDILEMIGGRGREKTVHGTAHWDSNGKHSSYGGKDSLTSGTFHDKFHVFSIIWNSQKITWYLDNVRYHELDITPADLSELNGEFFILINLAVGGNWPGNPDHSTQFPQRLFVDYIRVFQ